MSLEDKINKKIKNLKDEARSLVDERAAHEQRLFQIDTRLTHLSGAISELEQLTQEKELDETTNINQ
jgi:septation ring formation regulator EzrA